jgi:hypothetical protein
MARFLPRAVVLSIMLLGGLFGVRWFEENSKDAKHEAALAAKDQVIAAERQKNDVLRSIVKRLQTDKRMARVIVGDQQVVNGKVESTKIAFSEYDKDGKKLLDDTTRDFTVDGDTVYVAAYVVEFDDALVAAGDPLRGHSVAVFQRIFGKKGQEFGYELRSAADAPSPGASAVEQEVWRDFWKLSEDAGLRKKYGVKRAVGKAVFSEQFKPGFVYTLTLDPRGNLSMDTDPMDPLIDRMLREKRGSPATTQAAR